MPEISVIISTYNQPKWLQNVLWGYELQTYTDFEILIADDGSTKETEQLIQNFSKVSNLTITHVWQEDDGFRKTQILNKALAVAKGNYIICTDGDCIPRKDFIQRHFELRKPKHFLSGGYFKLPKTISDSLEQQDIVDQSCFDKNWLLSKGLKKTFKLNKLTASGTKEFLLNTFTPTKATWDGMNASGWKADILKVNGFDERMTYGGEDRELGERLMNSGIKPIQIRYSAICVHLFHERTYKNEASEQANLEIRRQTKSEKRTWTPFGIKKG